MVCPCYCISLSQSHMSGLRLTLILPTQARVTVVDWLKELGLFRGTEGNKMRLGVCSRSRDVIEPVLKPQW